MKRACLAIAASCLLLGTAQAQPNATRPQAQGVLVALIDIPRVFEEYQAFQSRLDGFKEELKAFEQEIVDQTNQIKKQAERLNELNSDSAEHKALTARLTQEQSNVGVKTTLKRKEVLEKEARQYFDAYNEVLAVIDRVAQANKIALVIRFDSKEVDPANLNSVAMGINRMVVYQRNLDITEMVINQLNRSATARRQ